MKRPGRLLCEAWEAAAMIEGTMCQKRVPGPAHFWKPGQLRWVQEPFIEFVGRREPTKYGIVYRADTKGDMAGAPPHLKHVDCKVKVRAAEEMRMGSSRLTIEVTDVVVGDRVNIYDLDRDHLPEGWNVALRWGLDSAPILCPRIAPAALIRFNVIHVEAA